MAELIVGDTYRMNHQRKGSATVKVLQINGEWIDVVLVAGSVKGIGSGSYREAGDTLTVRDSLATFTPLH